MTDLSPAKILKDRLFKTSGLTITDEEADDLISELKKEGWLKPYIYRDNTKVYASYEEYCND